MRRETWQIEEIWGTRALKGHPIDTHIFITHTYAYIHSHRHMYIAHTYTLIHTYTRCPIILYLPPSLLSKKISKDTKKDRDKVGTGTERNRDGVRGQRWRKK